MAAEQRGLGVEPGSLARLDQRALGRVLRRVGILTLVLGTVAGLLAWAVALAYLTTWLIHQLPI
jgi:hypothetical protein